MHQDESGYGLLFPFKVWCFRLKNLKNQIYSETCASSVLSDEKELEDTEVQSEADIDDDDGVDDVPAIVVEEECPAIKHGHSGPPDLTEGNDAIKQELVATSAKKHVLQKSRMKALGAMQADENLLSQEMFISIHGNQFKHNGKGSFGTFLY